MDLLQSLFSNVWSVLLIALFFGGSIFVHELGHFLVARRRGMVVERFSIGFGPRVFGWRGQDGVEYRLSWFPFGGYVLIPQLSEGSEMPALEGESQTDRSKLPKPTYSSMMLVLVAGVTCNLIFAFALACVLWLVGLPTTSDLATTRIGYVQAKLDTADGKSVISPASEGGLHVGDTVRAIDGRTVEEWQDLVQTLRTGAGHATDGRRESVFTIERGGQLMDLTLHPLLSGEEQMRRVGISPAYEAIVQKVNADTDAAHAGLLPQDRLVALDGTPILNLLTLGDLLEKNPEREHSLRIRRGTDRPVEITLTVPARPEAKDSSDFGAEFTTDTFLSHPAPVNLIIKSISTTYYGLLSLLNPHSDIGLSKITGPVGIVHLYSAASQVDIRYALWLTIIINVSLAFFNLLPIPVLDGGHMLFATIGRLRGRALPANFIAATQGVFMLLLLTVALYVSFSDVRRLNPAEHKDKPPGPAPVAAPAK